MKKFIDPWHSLPATNVLCECKYKDSNIISKARLTMDVSNGGCFRWMNADNVILSPSNRSWRYVIEDPEERRKEASAWFASLQSEDLQE